MTNHPSAPAKLQGRWKPSSMNKTLAVAVLAGLMLTGCGGAKQASLASTAEKTATATPTATPTPTATSPANATCTTAAATQKYNSQVFVCTAGSDQRLIWMSEADSKRVLAEKAAAEKAAAAKAAAEKAAAEKAAADQAAAAKAAADKAAADQAAAAKAAADQAAAQQAAQQQAAKQQVQAPVAPAPAPAAAYYANCTDARNKGAAPIYAGQPGYRAALDRDNDGVACE